MPWLPPLQLLGWVALVGFGAAGRPVLAGLGLLLVAGPVGVVLVERGPELLAVPLGAAILLAGEAAFLAADLSGPGPTDGGALRWRLLLGLGVVALGMGAALLVLVVAALPGRGGVGLTLLGVAAALALLLGVGWATRTRLGL